MNIQEVKYSRFSIVKEMFDVINIIKEFNFNITKEFIPVIKRKKGILLTGEGSSRIFPAKMVVYNAMKKGVDIFFFTEGSTQANEYRLSDYIIFGASNSGKTKEIIKMFQKLKSGNHDSFFGITANQNTPLEELAIKTLILSCGKENAIAATKSVIEQALFYHSLLYNLTDENMPDLNKVAKKIEDTLTLKIDPAIIQMIKDASLIYFAGRNNGVAEELTLKTNEILRKKSDYLEGTYLMHGIEEVMNKNEILIIIDPFENEEENIKRFLGKDLDMKIIAVSSRETVFPTIKVPFDNNYKEYIELVCGWNILVEAGILSGIDLDHPVRARKIGNEI